MAARHTDLPRRWLMTDERLGDRLWTAIARLPEGESGIVFRHYRAAQEEREALARDVARTCAARDITLCVAGDCNLARDVGAMLVHNPNGPCLLPFSMSVHTAEEADHARRRGAALVFVSPVHMTRSHPGRPPLGPAGASRLALEAAVPAIALGGMNDAAFRALPAGVFHGWAGIDAWSDGTGD